MEFPLNFLLTGRWLSGTDLEPLFWYCIGEKYAELDNLRQLKPYQLCGLLQYHYQHWDEKQHRFAFYAVLRELADRQLIYLVLDL